MKAKNVEVRIECDDEPLSEYGTKEETGLVSTFIPSEVGKQFKIGYCNSSASQLHVALFCDGVPVDCFLCDPAKIAQKFEYIIGPTVDSYTRRPLLFSHLQLTDDERALAPDRRRTWEDLGTIKLRIWRCERLADASDSKHSNPTLQREPVHEKTKKAGAHTVALGEPIKSDLKLTRCHTRRIDSENSPYMQFIWRYRPKAILQAQGIIPLDLPRANPAIRPRTPLSASAGAPAKRRRTEDRATPEAGGSRQEIKPEVDDKELETLLAEREAIEARIREAEGRRVKREPSAIRLVACKEGEVIDLTLD